MITEPSYNGVGIERSGEAGEGVAGVEPTSRCGYREHGDGRIQDNDLLIGLAEPDPKRGFESKVE